MHNISLDILKSYPLAFISVTLLQNVILQVAQSSEVQAEFQASNLKV